MRQSLCRQLAAGQAPTHPLCRQILRLPRLREELFHQFLPPPAPADTLSRETVSLRGVWAGVQPAHPPQHPPAGAQWRAALQLPRVQQELHHQLSAHQTEAYPHWRAPHICPDCGKSFSQSSNVITHWQLQHEQTAIWDAVASYIQQQLLLRKGVRIPTLGSFDVVPAQKQVGTETVTIQRPVFRLSRILRDIHNLMENEDDLSDHKVLAPVKYARVATDAHVSRCKVEGCILGTMSLLSHCLAKGKSIALVLRDAGVLLIEDRMVQMRFYYDFLEEISGKTNLRMAAFIFPQLLDKVVSRMVPVSSLTRTSRVIIFPELELEFVPKSQSRHPLKVSRRALGEDMWKKEEDLPPIRQHTKAGLPEVPLPADSSSVANKEEELHNKAAMNKRTKRQARQLPGIPGAVSGKRLLASGQSQGKPAAKGQAAKPNQTQAARLQRHKQGQGEKIYRVGSKFNTEKNSSMSAEAWMPKELTFEVMTPLPTRDEAARLLQLRPERFWSVLKDPQYAVLAGYKFTIPHVMPDM